MVSGKKKPYVIVNGFCTAGMQSRSSARDLAEYLRVIDVVVSVVKPLSVSVAHTLSRNQAVQFIWIKFTTTCSKVSLSIAGRKPLKEHIGVYINLLSSTEPFAMSDSAGSMLRNPILDPDISPVHRFTGW